MKNIVKIIFGASIAVMFASCNVENLKSTYTPDGSGVTFLSSASVNDQVDLSKSTVFNIPIARQDAAGALTVALEGEIEGLSVPTSVTFQAGEYQANIPVDISDMQPGITYKGSLKIADESVYNDKLATTELSISLSMKLEWELIGTGTYHYNGDCYWSGDDPGLEIYRAKYTDYYKISNYGYGVDFKFFYYPDENITLVENQWTGYNHSSYGALNVADQNVYWPGDETKDVGFYDEATKTYYFSVVYFVSAGYFGYGLESFELD